MVSFCWPVEIKTSAVVLQRPNNQHVYVMPTHLHNYTVVNKRGKTRSSVGVFVAGRIVMTVWQIT